MPQSPEMSRVLLLIYRALYDYYGPQRWWPTSTGSCWEIMLGAVLTQRTSWANVEAALNNISAAWGAAGLAQPERVLAAPDEELRELLRPVGHYRSKPQRVKNLARFVMEKSGVEDLVHSGEGTGSLRGQLLHVWGIGPETADAILLYGLGRPVFVADAYALRLASRWGLLPPRTSYHAIQRLFMDNLPHDVALFNEYHALIVAHGKEICRPRPLCPSCPLNRQIEDAASALTWRCPRLHTSFALDSPAPIW